MPFPFKRNRLALLAASPTLLVAAAPAERLSYDPAVFAAGECLSPALSGCGTAANVSVELSRRSASEALLDAGREPRLALDVAVLSDIGTELSGGVATGSPLAR